MRYDVHFYVDYDGKTKVATVPRKPRQGRHVYTETLTARRAAGCTHVAVGEARSQQAD